MATIEKTATYEPPGRPCSPVGVKDHCENVTGGAWTAPKTGEYRENLSPATGGPFCDRDYSTPDDVDGAAMRFSLEGLDGVHFPTVRLTAAC